MEWSEVLADPSLRDLPYKIELDHGGRILMTPASNRHARLQSRVFRLLAHALSEGETLTECSVATPAGVRVPDVAWASPAFVARHIDATPFPAAPELCVEVVSPSNRTAEMAEKVALYLAAGADEVWLVSDGGTISIHGRDGPRATTALPINLPARLL